jgi:hypothetical protein
MTEIIVARPVIPAIFAFHDMAAPAHTRATAAAAQERHHSTARPDLSCLESYPCPFRLIRGKSRIELLLFIEWRGQGSFRGNRASAHLSLSASGAPLSTSRQPVCLPSLCSTSNPSAQVVMAEAAEYDEELADYEEQEEEDSTKTTAAADSA